jgi:aspartate kinase
MNINKFGGASVKSAEGVKNLAKIVEAKIYNGIIVVSALGKTTNNLEKLAKAIYKGHKSEFFQKLSEIKAYHFEIINKLFNSNHAIFEDIENIFFNLEEKYSLDVNDFDFLYDQVVSYGELLSTRIVSAYLETIDLSNEWVDIREQIITDKVFREAILDWKTTRINIKKRFDNYQKLYITQGFISGTTDGLTTTLGREGSDYTAAILANSLDAKAITIWKDVPGVLNADPRYFKNPVKIDKISYQEAIELAYYGAKIIHPKTIKPLQNKGIALFVKSFLAPDKEGSLIAEFPAYHEDKPIFILKKKQVLISIIPKDFSFVFEEVMSEIYSLFADYRIKVNLIQNSAINFTVCVDEGNSRVHKLIEELKANHKVLFNKGLELITVRHYNEKSLETLLKGRNVLVEQRSRHTAQFVMEE